MDVAESTFPTLSDPTKKCTDIIDSNRDSEPQRNDPTNALQQPVEKLENKKLKKKLPDFRTAVFPTPLQWIDAIKDGEVCAEILCSADLIQVD